MPGIRSLRERRALRRRRLPSARLACSISRGWQSPGRSPCRDAQRVSFRRRRRWPRRSPACGTGPDRARRGRRSSRRGLRSAYPRDGCGCGRARRRFPFGAVIDSRSRRAPSPPCVCRSHIRRRPDSTLALDRLARAEEIDAVVLRSGNLRQHASRLDVEDLDASVAMIGFAASESRASRRLKAVTSKRGRFSTVMSQRAFLYRPPARVAIRHRAFAERRNASGP